MSLIHRYCQICRNGFYCERVTAVYCSPKCRQRAARLRGEKVRLEERLRELQAILYFQCVP